MYYATLNEAFGVDKLEEEKTQIPKTRPTKPKTFAFSDKIFGEDVEESDATDTEPPLAPVSEDRKLSNAEVKKYITNLYKTNGLNAVWNLFDKRIQLKLMGMCKDMINDAKTFFDDILSSPEKIMMILAILFVIIIILDSGSGNKHHHCNHTQGYYYPQPQAQFYQGNVPFQGSPSINPISIS